MLKIYLQSLQELFSSVHRVPVLLNLFFLPSNRVFTEGTCKLLNLVVTDLVDEDLVRNQRQQAASALLFGMVALVTKPGQTFAPLIGTWLLCAYTGRWWLSGAWDKLLLFFLSWENIAMTGSIIVKDINVFILIVG